ncbi:MAG TPA: flagellar motor switch protein FliM [Candidatus Hydrogenedentes bacterium]|nr:flagellar motor switch protein FliM [Candidatus Hydrogenedentota bacterium]
MPDILSQDEIDLLLGAVSKGEIAIEEIQSAAPDVRDTSTYDFRRPERVSKEQFKGLQSLFEAFSRELSIILPPFLRSVVRVDLMAIDQLTYDEFILSVGRPTSRSIVNMAPLDGQAVVELNPAIVFPMVDRLLGGKGQPLERSRELTEIENRVIHRVILMILDCLKRSWEQLIEFRMTIVAMESDPLIVQIVAGSEMVILVGYEVHIGDSVGTMNMCIPLLVLNPVLDQISQQTRYIRRMPADVAARTREQIAKTLRHVTVPLDAILGHAVLSLEELARLQIGDIIQLDSEMNAPIGVEVGGLVRFKAAPGRRSEQSSVQLLEIVRDD